MISVRKDPLSGKIVVVAQNRHNKPYDFSKQGKSKPKDCPFCPGNEWMTPPSIKENLDEMGRWKHRIFENKYPILSHQDEKKESHEFYFGMNQYGYSEVLVDTRSHFLCLYDMKDEDLAEFFFLACVRIQEIENIADIQYVQLFKNYGKEAGASLEHSHWQLLGFSFFPEKQKQILANINAHQKKTARCLYCDIIQFEKKYQKRVILENEFFLAFCPYASLYPFEIQIAPKCHICHLQQLDQQKMLSFVSILKQLLRRIKKHMKNFSYNLLIMNKPKACKDFHFYVSILPRIGAIGGLEIGSDTHVLTISPEMAANLIKSEEKD